MLLSFCPWLTLLVDVLILCHVDALSDSLNQKLSELLHNDHLQNSEEMRIVDFRGTYIRIENEELRVLLLECRDQESLLLTVNQSDEEKVLSQFGVLFEKYDKCLRVINNEKDKVVKSTNSSKLNDLTLLFAIYKYFKELRLVERNVLLLNNYIQMFRANKQTNLNNLIAL